MTPVVLEEVLDNEERRARGLARMLKELGELYAEELLDEALRETFPASDSPAPADPAPRTGARRRHRGAGTTGAARGRRLQLNHGHADASGSTGPL